MFYSIIIPIKNLRKVLTTVELDELLSKKSNEQVDFYDEFLYRECSMNAIDNEQIIKQWEKRGLTPIGEKDGKQYWKDLCLVEYPNTEPTLPCEWIEIYRGNGDDWGALYARYKDTKELLNN